MTSSSTAGTATTYTYGQNSSNMGLLLSTTRGSNAISYDYDQYGRVTRETRTVSGLGTRTTNFSYRSDGLLNYIQYPGPVTAAYMYDSYGNRKGINVNGTTVWLTESVSAQNSHVTTTIRKGNSLKTTVIADLAGRVTGKSLSHVGGSAIRSMSFYYNAATGNMTGRTGMFPVSEAFANDDLDRLTGIQYGDGSAHDITYAPNGNITTQTDIGRYYYEGGKPHAVTSVDNTRGRIPTSQLDTEYNVFGKISQIRDYGENNYRMLFDYGPDNERWRTRLYKDYSTLQRTTYYLGDYEEIVEGGTTRRLYYIGGDELYKKQTNCPDSVFYLFTDHLGSVVAILDQSGNEKFSATYDAWGNQTVTRNDINFHRGYTGHEMLPEFGIINMNGRLYDPQIGRFLSTDNYVQEPWNSQNFNRYSYCLNNPLKYTDPNGEFFTWLFGNDGFSIGLNFGFFGFGLNFGYENFSVGIYGELGPRVGGTGFGAGAAISQSLDYSLPNESFSTSTSLGVYGSLGLLNVGANTSYTYGNNGGYSWNVNAGVNIIGTDEEGLGLNVGYGSNGWSFGIGGYVNPSALDDNPEFIPEIWNDERAREYNNCYSYALDYLLEPTLENYNNNGLQPGFSQGKRAEQGNNYSSEILSLALADGKIKKPTFWNKLGFGKKGYYEVYLVFTPNDYIIQDYHWYRKDSNGLWSHKPGRQLVSNVDKSGNLIYNPAKANHGRYTQGGFLLWVKR